MSSPPTALEASVLVLNKMFMAVHVISVRSMDRYLLLRPMTP